MTDLEIVEGATIIKCADCDAELAVDPDVEASIEHNDDGSHTYTSRR